MPGIITISHYHYRKSSEPTLACHRGQTLDWFVCTAGLYRFFRQGWRVSVWQIICNPLCKILWGLSQSSRKTNLLQAQMSLSETLNSHRLNQSCSSDLLCSRLSEKRISPMGLNKVSHIRARICITVQESLHIWEIWLSAAPKKVEVGRKTNQNHKNELNKERQPAAVRQ